MTQSISKKSSAKRNKLQGQKRPFSPDDLRTIRAVLHNQQNWRDLSLFCVAVDTMLRSSDVLSLRVEDVTNHKGDIVEQFLHRQIKTGRGVLVGLTPQTRTILQKWITESGKMSWDFLFTSEKPKTDQPITTGQYRRLVKGWAQLAALDPRQYSGHSTRRTKASIVYRETGNPEMVRHLLGHSSITSTSEYLNVSAESAVQQALNVKV